jgi:adenosylcobinamide kinase/adenosylcobinamide-phosphate guanylyltransferase
MNSSQPCPKIILITGAARSGKSEWAEKLASKTSLSVIYIATATIESNDLEWQAKIAKHQQRRPKNWQTKVASQDLANMIKKAATSECLLIDSLGTWVANFLDLDRDDWQQLTDELLTSLKNNQGHIILVGEETGWGVVPAYQSGRTFRDRLGHLIRQIGSIADTVYLVTGGHVLNLTLLGEPL